MILRNNGFYTNRLWSIYCICSDSPHASGTKIISAVMTSCKSWVHEQAYCQSF